MTLFGSATAPDAVPHTTHVDTLDTATRRMATRLASRVDTGLDTLRTPEPANMLPHREGTR